VNDPSAAHRRAPALAEQRVVLAGAFPGPDLPNGADLVDADLLIVSFTAVPGDVSVLAALPDQVAAASPAR
jgi:hypothetical protein